MKNLINIILIFSFLSVKAQDHSLLCELEHSKIGTELTEEIAKKFFGAKPDYYGTLHPIELDYFERCNDTALAILTYGSGTGSYSVFSVITESFNYKKKGILIEDISDHDGSYAIYESTSYNFIHSNLIEIVNHETRVKDKSKYDTVSNWIKSGYSFWDLETVTFDSYSYIKLKENCKFSMLKPNKHISEKREFKKASAKILRREEINSMSKKNLRIMRNEIFADYGYIFKSSDLNEYFKKTSWYQPKNVNTSINSRLSEIEKINIDLILSLERKNSN